VRAMAHITGGGLPGNLPRVLPKGLGARLELAAWPRPEVFGWLAGLGVEEDEMRRVFNLGLGYLVVVPAGEADEAIRIAVAAGHPAYRAGEIVPGAGVELV
jgi:phosphoribosylformylglycinamidine cyclo-ligase